METTLYVNTHPSFHSCTMPTSQSFFFKLKLSIYQSLKILSLIEVVKNIHRIYDACDFLDVQAFTERIYENNTLALSKKKFAQLSAKQMFRKQNLILLITENRILYYMIIGNLSSQDSFGNLQFRE